MTAARAGRREVSGVLLLDKPGGITSHTAVQRVKRFFSAARAGHTGTLDPLATGLLPVCLGEATKFSQLLLEADKTYLASIRLDLTTTTGDIEGEVTGRFDVAVGREALVAMLRRFEGEIEQTPPMYSALKHEGQPLYKIARAGREVPRAPRKVRVGELALIEQQGPELIVRVRCSKGTYVRVLAEDIGRALGCGGCLAALRRERVGAFALPGVTLEQLEGLSPAERDRLLLPADALLATLPRLDLDARETQRLTQGQAIERAGVGGDGLLARLYGPDREFLGVAEIVSPGRIVPRRLTARG